MTAEARVLHVLLDGDETEARKLLKGFTRRELAELEDVSALLAELCAEEHKDRKQ